MRNSHPPNLRLGLTTRNGRTALCDSTESEAAEAAEAAAGCAQMRCSNAALELSVGGAKSLLRPAGYRNLHKLTDALHPSMHSTGRGLLKGQVAG
ncbi:uncharacterized protein MYCFIDRAFT_209632 [Pseudocercospora fijiensis CIRAD86]|uniref:Uncharacterized protein n=1 Tax=Pseudocercospora fijiensis (strain CIRAD86) TaxID=383855 RepID=N1Q6C2_PSEFD|nr:uncharacterized protein MYCFIDRAFT_209632 [Pseudocercospora fijiensis CIRAD86]EME87860.1 hypothetical protein MYCFIDRAFT_209632 [Pseudocercospora fijiensis CIRAD86]